MLHWIWVLIVGAIIGAIAGATTGRGGAMGWLANILAGAHLLVKQSLANGDQT